MGKKRFFDDRLKYLSFIQNTSEKKAISQKLYPYIAGLSQNKSYLRVLDAGTGDGTIKSNVIKSFHRYHPYTSLLITHSCAPTERSRIEFYMYPKHTQRLNVTCHAHGAHGHAQHTQSGNAQHGTASRIL